MKSRFKAVADVLALDIPMGAMEPPDLAGPFQRFTASKSWCKYA
jgi:hypothetical protein